MKRFLFIVRTIWSNLRNARALVEQGSEIAKLKQQIEQQVEQLSRINSTAVSLAARVKMHQQVLCALVQRHGYGNDIYTMHWADILEHEKNECLVDRKDDRVRLRIQRPSTARYIVKNPVKSKEEAMRDASS